MDIEKDHNFVIYFASQTGTAEDFASVLSSEASENGLVGKVIDLSEVTESTFLSEKKCVFVMATHYEGEPPDNAAQFWSWFEGSEHPELWLKEHKFTVFALGDTAHEHFAKIGTYGFFF